MLLMFASRSAKPLVILGFFRCWSVFAVPSRPPFQNKARNKTRQTATKVNSGRFSHAALIPTGGLPGED